jgi:hypothetical protein
LDGEFAVELGESLAELALDGLIVVLVAVDYVASDEPAYGAAD